MMCGKDPELIILAPIKRPGGAFDSLVCRECAVDHRVYCEKHEKPHTGFVGDNSTACLYCISDDLEAKRPIATGVLKTLEHGLRKAEFEKLMSEASITSRILLEDHSVSVLRFILTKAHRRKETIHRVILRTLRLQSASAIL